MKSLKYISLSAVALFCCYIGSKPAYAVSGTVDASYVISATPNATYPYTISGNMTYTWSSGFAQPNEQATVNLTPTGQPTRPYYTTKSQVFVAWKNGTGNLPYSWNYNLLPGNYDLYTNLLETNNNNYIIAKQTKQVLLK